MNEDTIKKAFVDVMNSMIRNKAEILHDYEDIIRKFTDTSDLDREAANLKSEIEIVSELIQLKFRENTQRVLDQDEYRRQEESLILRHNEAERKHNELQQKRRERQDRKIRMASFLDVIRKQEGLLTEFDEGIWNALVESVNVYDEKRLTFRFKSGNEVECKIE